MRNDILELAFYILAIASVALAFLSFKQDK